LVKKVKTIALKAAKKKSSVSSVEDTDEKEDAVTMLAKNFNKLRKDLRGLRCFECTSYRHMRADCGNLKQTKGKAYNATLNDDSEEEKAPSKDQKFLDLLLHMKTRRNLNPIILRVVMMDKKLKRPTRSSMSSS